MTYNVSKGKNTLEESEILEPMHACLRELMEYDLKGKSHLLKFTDHDIIAITLLYSTILGNRFAHNLVADKASQKVTAEISHNYAKAIQNLTLGMTRVDVVGHYKEREQK